jgi:hypothetical protein
MIGTTYSANETSQWHHACIHAHARTHAHTHTHTLKPNAWFKDTQIQSLKTLVDYIFNTNIYFKTNTIFMVILLIINLTHMNSMH